MTPPTADQLDHLIGHTDHRALTPDEAAALRDGVQRLRAQLAGAGAAVRRAPSGAYVTQLRRQAARADRYRAAWQNARRRAQQQHSIVERYRAEHLATLTTRAEQAEARIIALIPCIERVLAATGRMVEHWADAGSTGNTEWQNDMWTELHRSADALAATFAGEPVPVNVPDGACGAYAARHGAACARPKDHPEAYHRDASDRVYWLAEAQP
ncbi:hypothetical protein [Kitasatospora cathayae]|uniref:Uncharacterized protein n=1 Tax=Kitasatospora cathayae TaxID=3004092 RepID=A0ABY7Q9S5_9ACTN|nr:hypothetical protein [Kitasatospora sp. HUAS 3-15]WBP89507.1 hypothetical protein O1G21_29150 [Kitasatospora sp. HUAS 3-15]